MRWIEAAPTRTAFCHQLLVRAPAPTVLYEQHVRDKRGLYSELQLSWHRARVGAGADPGNPMRCRPSPGRRRLFTEPLANEQRLGY